jgi:hypothetical protein
MNLKHGWKQRLKVPELPPTATIFPFQRRHVDVAHLKLPAIPPVPMHIIYDAPRPDLVPPRGS